MLSLRNTPLLCNKNKKKINQKEASTQVLQSASYHLNGFVNTDVVISQEKGYLHWSNPISSCDIVFKYKDTGYNFNLYFDPEFQGVEIYEILSYRKRQIYNGYDNLDEIRQKKNTRKPNTFRLISEDGFVRLRLYLLDNWESVCPNMGAHLMNKCHKVKNRISRKGISKQEFTERNIDSLKIHAIPIGGENLNLSRNFFVYDLLNHFVNPLETNCQYFL